MVNSFVLMCFFHSNNVFNIFSPLEQSIYKRWGTNLA